MTDFVTEIALLGAKIDANQASTTAQIQANQAETSAKLDGIEKLMAAQTIHANQVVTGLSGEITKVSGRVDAHDTRLNDLEAERSEDKGAERTRNLFLGGIWGILMVVVGWIVGHLPSLKL